MKLQLPIKTSDYLLWKDTKDKSCIVWPLTCRQIPEFDSGIVWPCHNLWILRSQEWLKWVTKLQKLDM